MQPGSLVLTVYDFKHERERWGYNYPKKGDILTIKMMAKNPGPDLCLQDGKLIPSPRKKPIFDLIFEELNTVPLADKKVNGEPNFIEIQSPEEALELLKSLENEKSNSISEKVMDQI